jgi:hypothetical protein
VHLRKSQWLDGDVGVGGGGGGAGANVEEV